MAGKLIREIGQTKPFTLIEEEAVLNISRTAEVLSQRMAEFLKPFGLSPTQYNVLRILRGAGSDGVTCSQLGDRMIARDPDTTRLLDRMEARGWVVRERSKEDRRIVISRISEQGEDLVNGIDAPVRSLLRSTIGRIPKKELVALIDVLETVRTAFE